jgi:uncharacterized repeat protein (TIGR01451 family)
VPFRSLARLLAGVVCTLGLAGAALAAPAAPAFASGGADLTVTMASTPAALRAGAHVAYRITVHNLGPDTAAKVSIDFITSAAMTSPTWTVSAGRCLRSPAETACLFGTLKPGGSAWATIGGILPKALPPGTEVRNSVTLTSDTTLVNPAQAVINASYTMPGGSPSASPPPATGSPGPPAQVAPPRPDTRTSPLWKVVAVAGLGVGVIALGSALTIWLRSRRRASV